MTAFFFSQATNKNLALQAEELVKSNQAEVIAKKLEEKLTSLSGGKSSELEAQVAGSLKQLKSDLKELLETGGKSGGLSEADRTFLKELSNDTKDAIQDMRLEVLTASDKSKFPESSASSFLYCKQISL